MDGQPPRSPSHADVQLRRSSRRSSSSSSSSPATTRCARSPTTRAVRDRCRPTCSRRGRERRQRAPLAAAARDPAAVARPAPPVRRRGGGPRSSGRCGTGAVGRRAPRASSRLLARDDDRVEPDSSSATRRARSPARRTCATASRATSSSRPCSPASSAVGLVSAVSGDSSPHGRRRGCRRSSSFVVARGRRARACARRRPRVRARERDSAGSRAASSAPSTYTGDVPRRRLWRRDRGEDDARTIRSRSPSLDADVRVRQRRPGFTLYAQQLAGGVWRVAVPGCAPGSCVADGDGSPPGSFGSHGQGEECLDDRSRADRRGVT